MAERNAGGALPVALLQRLATAAEMREMDRHAIDDLALPGRVLMENAARAVADCVDRLMAGPGKGMVGNGTVGNGTVGNGTVVVCCGSGNNGGDGYAVARLLKNRGRDVVVLDFNEPVGGDARANRVAWIHFGEIYNLGTDPKEARKFLDDAAVVVDALLGTGVSRPVEGAYGEWIEWINASPSPIKVAVDLPSGVHTDTGAVQGVAVACTHTVTLQVGKPGCYQWPGAGYAGQVEVADISIPPQWGDDAAPTYRITEAFARALLPPRRPDGHKGSFGHLLAVCGSVGMGGAALLAGKAGLKTGAGLVTVAVPRVLRDRFLASAPELMTLAADEGDAEAFAPEHVPIVLEAAAARTVVVLGCGLGRREGSGQFVREIVAKVEKPLLIDADGLFPLTGDDLAARSHPTVITPHPGELARLAGISVSELSTDRIGQARRLAEAWGVVLVLKGAGTVVAEPSGVVVLQPFADDGLASGGTGDVLSGMIGGLLAQGMAPFAAALLGTYLHGRSREERRDLTGAYFSATDLITGIDPALRALGAG